MSIMEGWRAARVVRKHTLPYHRKEILAEHTWGVLHILFYIYPDVPMRTVKGALYHDIGEHGPGDIPGDFKAMHPEVRDACVEHEDAAARRVLPVSLHDSLDLSDWDLALIKFCDKIEFGLSCYHEWMMGNRYSLPPMERTVEMAHNSIPNAMFVGLPDQVQMNISAATAEITRLMQEMRNASK